MSGVGSSIKKEKSKICEMILMSPGMSDNCKINLKITRQNALLLGTLIEVGILNSKGISDDEIVGSLSEESVAEFKSIHEEILKRSGLTEFYERLKQL